MRHRGYFVPPCLRVTSTAQGLEALQMHKLMIAALGAVVLTASVALPSIAQEKSERDYLVHQGKRAVWASELRRQQAQQKPPVSARASRHLTHQRGRIVQQGKQQIFIPDEQLPLVPRLNRRELAGNRPSSPQIPSRGRFVQQGKVHIWVEDQLPLLKPDPRQIADELPPPGPTVID